MFMTTDTRKTETVAKAVSIFPYSPRAGTYFGNYDVSALLDAPNLDAAIWEVRGLDGIGCTLVLPVKKSYQPKNPLDLEPGTLYRARVLVKAKADKIDGVAEAFRSISNIRDISTVSRIYPIYHIVAGVEASSSEELGEVVTEKIRRTEDVERTWTMLELQGFNNGTLEYSRRENSTSKKKS